MHSQSVTPAWRGKCGGNKAGNWALTNGTREPTGRCSEIDSGTNQALLAAKLLIAGGNRWRANEIVMRHLTRQTDPATVDRAAERPIWLHRYNWHRPHGSLRSKPPISRHTQTEDNCR